MAAKRYHQTRKDRKDESRGMKKALRHDDSSRRHREMYDAGMISEDHNQVANLPQEVVMRSYPKIKDWMRDGDLDDTLRGVDRQMDADDAMRSRHMMPKKV